MLWKFLYLDSQEVDGYLSMVEDGLLAERKDTTNKTQERSLSGNLEVLSGGGSNTTVTGSERKTLDTPEARFNRLLSALKAFPEEYGFHEVLDPDTEFTDAGIGSIVLWEADVGIPQFLRMASSDGEAVAAIEMLREFAPNAKRAGLEMKGIPDLEVLEGYVGMMRSLNLNSLCVGDDDESDWTLAGAMKPEGIRQLPQDERALMLGKVRKRIADGASHHMMAVPGMGLAREKRRSLNRSSEVGREEQYLEGPLLLLDLIAVFR